MEDPIEFMERDLTLGFLSKNEILQNPPESSTCRGKPKGSCPQVHVNDLPSWKMILFLREATKCLKEKTGAHFKPPSFAMSYSSGLSAEQLGNTCFPDCVIFVSFARLTCSICLLS